MPIYMAGSGFRQDDPGRRAYEGGAKSPDARWMTSHRRRLALVAHAVQLRHVAGAIGKHSRVSDVDRTVVGLARNAIVLQGGRRAGCTSKGLTLLHRLHLRGGGSGNRIEPEPTPSRQLGDKQCVLANMLSQSFFSRLPMQWRRWPLGGGRCLLWVQFGPRSSEHPTGRGWSRRPGRPLDSLACLCSQVLTAVVSLILCN